MSWLLLIHNQAIWDALCTYSKVMSAIKFPQEDFRMDVYQVNYKYTHISALLGTERSILTCIGET